MSLKRKQVWLWSLWLIVIVAVAGAYGSKILKSAELGIVIAVLAIFAVVSVVSSRFPALNRLGTGRSAQWISDGYNRLGCGAFLCLLILALVGLIFTSKAAVVVGICMQFGREAYFRDGVRPLPHPGFFHLSNGQIVAPIYQLASVLIWMVLFTGWIAVSLLVVVGTHERIQALRARKP
jgi:hypothetical protein